MAILKAVLLTPLVAVAFILFVIPSALTHRRKLTRKAYEQIAKIRQEQSEKYDSERDLEHEVRQLQADLQMLEREISRAEKAMRFAQRGCDSDALRHALEDYYSARDSLSVARMSYNARIGHLKDQWHALEKQRLNVQG